MYYFFVNTNLGQPNPAKSRTMFDLKPDNDGEKVRGTLRGFRPEEDQFRLTDVGLAAAPHQTTGVLQIWGTDT